MATGVTNLSHLFEGLTDTEAPQPDKPSTDVRRIIVNFASEADVATYAKHINRAITTKTKELKFPEPKNSLFDFCESAFYEEPPSKKRKSAKLNEHVFDYEQEPGYYELHWQNMPEFHQPDAGAVRQITHYFNSESDVEQWAKTIQQNITPNTPSVWYPHRARNDVKNLYWISTKNE